jgi:hypothetical protein
VKREKGMVDVAHERDQVGQPVGIGRGLGQELVQHVVRAPA